MLTSSPSPPFPAVVVVAFVPALAAPPPPPPGYLQLPPEQEGPEFPPEYP